MRSPRVYARSWGSGWYGGGPSVSVGFGSPYYSSFGYSPYYSSYAYSPYSTWGAYGDTPRYWAQARSGSRMSAWAMRLALPARRGNAGTSGAGAITAPTVNDPERTSDPVRTWRPGRSITALPEAST